MPLLCNDKNAFQLYSKLEVSFRWCCPHWYQSHRTPDTPRTACTAKCVCNTIEEKNLTPNDHILTKHKCWPLVNISSRKRKHSMAPSVVWGVHVLWESEDETTREKFTNKQRSPFKSNQFLVSTLHSVLSTATTYRANTKQTGTAPTTSTFNNPSLSQVQTLFSLTTSR